MITDSITILRANGRCLAKRWHADGTSTGYDDAKRFSLHAEPITDLPMLGCLLANLSQRRDCAVVRGAIADPSRVRRERRLVHPDPETGDQPTLRDVPRRWLSLDLDGVPLPAGVDQRDLLACAQAVLPLLPVAVQQADLIVQATGSHGIKPGARLRIWGWCDRPLSGEECRRWFRGLPVDASLFRAAQLNYTAAPIFEAIAVDPLPQRLAWLPGQARSISAPSAAELAPPPPRTAGEPRKLNAESSSRYALAALTSACTAIRRQSEGTRHPTAVSEAWGLARLVKAGLLTEGEVTRAIDGALQDVGKPEGEGAAIVAWAVAQRGDSGKLPEGVQP